MSLLLLAPPRTTGEQIDRRLHELASRAQDRRTWPQLRNFAESVADAERRGRAYFVLGYREYDAGEFEAAMQDLRSAAETGFSLADHARYYWADAAYEAGQPTQAVETLKSFRARYPRSTLRFPALELLARSWLQAGQPGRAIPFLTAEPQVRLRPELSVLLAQAYRDARQAEEAARIFQEIYYAFPLTSQAGTAREAITQMRTELAERFPEVSEEVQTARADIFAGKSRWQEALDEYTGLLGSRSASPLAPRWQIGRARCLIRLGQVDQAIELLTTGLQPTPEIDPARLSLLVEAYLRNSDPAAAEIVFEQLGNLYPQTTSYASALAAFGNYHVRQGEWKEAARYYQPLVESFPQRDSGREAQWRLTWSYYLDGDLNRARDGFAQHLMHYPESDHVTGALYWLARIEEQRGAGADAQALYTLLRQRFVHSYYATQAELRVRELQNAAAEGGGTARALPSVAELASGIPPRAAPAILPCDAIPASGMLEPYLALRDLGLPELVAQYLLERLDDFPDSAELRLALSRFRAEQGKHALALFDARRIVPRYVEFEFSELPEELWRLLYPQEFFSLVKRYSRANAIDPHLVLGLIRQESAFNPQATSVANARGLMQILPQTVGRTRRGRARAGRRLYQPTYNIQFGTRHLRGLLKTFGGVPEQALAAYHAGKSRVAEWLAKRPFQEPAEFLETIPIPSTRSYVGAVLRDAAMYHELLTGKAKLAECRSPLSSRPKEPRRRDPKR